MTGLNALIVFGYVAACWALFERGIVPSECGVRRLKMVVLAVSFLCFGTGRFLSLTGSPQHWIYTAGHFALIGFAAIYIVSAMARDRKGISR